MFISRVSTIQSEKKKTFLFASLAAHKLLQKRRKFVTPEAKNLADKLEFVWYQSVRNSI